MDLGFPAMTGRSPLERRDINRRAHPFHAFVRLLARSHRGLATLLSNAPGTARPAQLPFTQRGCVRTTSHTAPIRSAISSHSLPCDSTMARRAMVTVGRSYRLIKRSTKRPQHVDRGTRRPACVCVCGAGEDPRAVKASEAAPTGVRRADVHRTPEVRPRRPSGALIGGESAACSKHSSAPG